MSIYVPGRLTLRKGWQPMDPDAAAYITAVETADAQTLEEPVKIAIDNFVLGCKNDGIWPAIKASCILAGARTLNGALVPLVGTAPTNFNFVAGDYNRKTGLVGNGSTKYLDSNRNNNADPQDSKHLAAYITQTATNSPVDIIGSGLNTAGHSRINHGGQTLFCRINDDGTSVQSLDLSGTRPTGFYGATRASAAGHNARVPGAVATFTVSSATPVSQNLEVFKSASRDNHYDGRLAFYSIGEALDLALLDARVTDLINAFGAAIP